MKISDVLWKAANEHLWDGRGLPRLRGDRHIYSCNALGAVMGHAEWYSSPTLDFIKTDMGCKTSSTRLFDKFKAGEERQGARYLWLMFAYLVAKDEGL